MGFAIKVRLAGTYLPGFWFNSFVKFATCCLALLSALFLSALPAGATIDTALQMQLGNPSNATADTNNHTHYLTQRTVEALDYNDTLGEPNWASWDLTASDIGTNSRSSFVTDTSLPPNFTRYSTGIYDNSGWNRGHLCPSKDRTDTSINNDLVFLMSNVLPQSGVNNSGVWLQFENYCRDLVQSTNNYELLLICGGSGYSGARLTNGPFIPGFVWKIAVVVPPGAGSATNRITATNRVIVIKVPNTDAATNNWQSYVTSANQVQVDTGLTFFTALPAGVASVLRSKVDGQTNAPPVIYVFSPGDGAANTNVIITGTNFASASAVAFNGVSAAFNLDSPTQISAMVPTNGTTGFISVTTSSGTAISSNSFIVHGGLSVYNGVLAGWDANGVTGFGVSPFDPTTNAPHVAVAGLTRSTGVGTSGGGLTGGWGGTGFTNESAAGAIAANIFVTFRLTASNGYQISVTNLSRFDYRRSTTGPTNGVLQFQVGGGGFVDVTNLAYASTSASGVSLGPINLSGFAPLQNIGAGTNVTFRIVNYGGTNAVGTWYVFDKAGTTAPDLAVSGTVMQVLSLTNAPAMAPVFGLPGYANNQFQFIINGTVGSNYVVQAATNLAMPVWVSLVTNPAPFLFVETNANTFGQRFYRSIVAP